MYDYKNTAKILVHTIVALYKSSDVFEIGKSSQRKTWKIFTKKVHPSDKIAYEKWRELKGI